jgi:hypothetical protein
MAPPTSLIGPRMKLTGASMKLIDAPMSPHGPAHHASWAS